MQRIRFAAIPLQNCADPFDFPFQLDSGLFFDAPPYLLAEVLDIRRARIAAVDQEVAVQLGHLRVADDKAAAAGGIDQLPSLVPGRILEGRAAGAAFDRLCRLAL